MSIDQAIHEECGVFGVIAPEATDVAIYCYYGLYALQHRGQEGCGIVVNDDGVFVSHKDLGLVAEVFTTERLSKFPTGTIAVGHVRYGTTGGNSRNNCQPIEVNHQKGRMALCHNGNLSNAVELRSELEMTGAIFHTTSDTETIAYIITKERLRTSSMASPYRIYWMATSEHGMHDYALSAVTLSDWCDSFLLKKKRSPARLHSGL